MIIIEGRVTQNDVEYFVIPSFMDALYTNDWLFYGSISVAIMRKIRRIEKHFQSHTQSEWNEVMNSCRIYGKFGNSFLLSRNKKFKLEN